jgi:hypothetical protein
MADRRKSRKEEPGTHDVWSCPVCSQQMVGGPRCPLGNPTPEEREAHPERYARMTLAPHVRDRRARET